MIPAVLLVKLSLFSDNEAEKNIIIFNHIQYLIELNIKAEVWTCAKNKT